MSRRLRGETGGLLGRAVVVWLSTAGHTSTGVTRRGMDEHSVCVSVYI